MNRRGVANSGMLIAVGSVVVVALLFWASVSAPEKVIQSQNDDVDSLVVYCAAGVKSPVEAAAKEFTEETGVQVLLQYAGSGELLAQMRIAKQGDLYLAADVSYIEMARENSLIDEVIPVAQQKPVIAVQKGNPKGIKSLDDLLRDDVGVALANPEVASIGRLTQKLLEGSKHWSRLQPEVKVFKPTVNHVTTDIEIGTVDAGIVWDANVRQIEKLEIVSVPELDKAKQEVSLAVLKTTQSAPLALKFARYLQAPTKGQQQFKSLGYETVDGDEWVNRPHIVLYSGGVNRLAIDDTIKKFKEREGALVDVVYNGCGILVSIINGGEMPDGYFACDKSYMVQVADKFGPSRVISNTEMVIITQKGNPRNIQTLADLAQEGLKVGLADSEKSALGSLTKNMMSPMEFEDGNLYDAVAANVPTWTPTADLLVNQLRVGGLDAAIVYLANVSLVKDEIEVVPITDADVTAVQPIAVGKNSKHRYLMQRLVDAITSDTSRQSFESRGFRWSVDVPQK